MVQSAVLNGQCSTALCAAWWGCLALCCCFVVGCPSPGDCDGVYPFCYTICVTDRDCDTTDAEAEACLVRVCSLGECLPVNTCQDGEVCADGVCKMECSDDAACDDDNLCTVDRCGDGRCAYDPVCGPCELCDPQTGECSGGCEE